MLLAHSLASKPSLTGMRSEAPGMNLVAVDGWTGVAKGKNVVQVR